ncbi:MAG: glycosyl hydrolase 108 family protein [Pseudomonadota bacterium]
MLIDQKTYRSAFFLYLRKGLSIEQSVRASVHKKQTQSTTHYIWRARDDDKVRSSHSANNGKVFAWNNPPETGHPGEDFNCRCWAEPTDYTSDSERTFGEVLLGHEGGFVNDPVDRGGATKYGITISTWRTYSKDLFGIEASVETLRQITPQMAARIFDVGYWQPSKAGHLDDIELAQLHSDTAYLAGPGTAARILQRAINRSGGKVDVDGAIGSKTLDELRLIDRRVIYEAYKTERWAHHARDIEKNPAQARFRNGWRNRLDSFDAYD